MDTYTNGIKNYLMEDFEPLKYSDIYSFVKSLDNEDKDILLTNLLSDQQRRMRKSPHQIAGELLEKKKELNLKIKL